MRRKQTPQPKHRLPVLNWVAMKSNQVKGTVFSELDDEKLYSVCMSLALSVLVRLSIITLADFGVSSSSHFHFRGWTDRHVHNVTDADQSPCLCIG